MTTPRPYSRTGLNALKTRVKLRGFGAIDRRTVGARLALAFKSDLVAALGGEADLSPQRRKLVDLPTTWLASLTSWGYRRSRPWTRTCADSTAVLKVAPPRR
jgi:hypothetical protein